MNMIPLQLPPGIIRGANPDDAPGRWFDGNMVRWRDGIMEPVGGWERITDQALADVPRRLHQWLDNRSIMHTLVGTGSSLNTINDGLWSDISPPNFIGFDTTTVALGYGAGPYGAAKYGVPIIAPSKLQHRRHAWSFGQWGEDVLAVASSDGRLLYHAANPAIVTQHPTKARYKQAAPVTVVANAPTGLRGVTVTPERHALVIQPDNEAREIAWCSRENINDWDFASTTNTAGKLPLRAETPLQSLLNVREGTLVFSETDIFLVRAVGLPYVYGADALGTANLFSPNGAVEWEGKAAWLDQTGFGLYQGGSITTLPCPLTDYVFSNIDRTWGPRVAFGFSNGVFNEVWWHYPSKGNQENNRFVMWNYVENWWSMGELPRSAGFTAGAGPYPLLGAPDGNVYQHETGWVYDGFQADGNIYIDSGTLNIGAGDRAMQIKQLIPSNGANYNMTDYTIYSRMTPAQAEVANGPYQARPDGYVDTRAQGRDIRIRIAANQPGDWSIGRIRMNVGEGGRR
jgi:hypothetical protein